jgi:small subunit ribosomal protein S6
LFILDSNRYARDAAAVSGTIPTLIEKLGGEVLANRLWNEQKLAYPIKGHRKGTYWLTYFRLDSERLTEFNRQCRLNENILRNLTLAVEPRLVEVLVSHAQGGGRQSAAGAPEAAAAESRPA